MKQFGALLHAPWKRGAHYGEIVGMWAEDGAEYEISVPEPLCYMLITMQNQLHAHYAALKKAEQEVLALRAQARALFPDTE